MSSFIQQTVKQLSVEAFTSHHCTIQNHDPNHIGPDLLFHHHHHHHHLSHRSCHPLQQSPSSSILVSTRIAGISRTILYATTTTTTTTTTTATVDPLSVPNDIPPSNRFIQRMQRYLPKSVSNIKKSMKIILYASFLIDAILLVWGGRQAISFVRSSSSTSSSPMSLVTTTWRALRQHVYHSCSELYQQRQPIFRSILALTILYSIYNAYSIQQRQTTDPTSEWERYAQYPMARTTAIFQIFIFQIVPLSLRILILQQLQRIVGIFQSSSQHTKYATQIIQLKERMGRNFANGLLQLGPLYIKMGQILSCREDVLPSEWMMAMERLQDQVPALSGTKAQQLAYTIWPLGSTSFDNTFVNVDWTPIAAASLGQVHTATLRTTNERVALKLQRPKLRTIYDNDLRLLKKIAATVDQFFGSTAGSVGGISQSWTSIFSDAEEILYREIDYRTEGQNAIRFSRDFGLTKGGQPATTISNNISTVTSRDGEPLPSAASWLRTPYVYDTLSTEQVLVMEYVPSIKISAIDTLTQANVTMADREYLADCLGRSYLRQFCCNQFFSTDPHAGNLGVELLNMQSNKPEERVRLVYYDFGQAAELQPNQADGILDIIEAIVDMDVDKSIVSFQKMGVLKDNADLDAVRAKVADNYRTGKVKANRKKLMKKKYQFKDVESINTTTNSSSSSPSSTTRKTTTSDAQVMQYFTLPAEYAFVGRALSQMDGVGKTLDSEFDFVSAAAPYIVEIKGAKKYVFDEWNKWWSNQCHKIRSILNIDKSTEPL